MKRRSFFSSSSKQDQCEITSLSLLLLSFVAAYSFLLDAKMISISKLDTITIITTSSTTIIFHWCWVQISRVVLIVAAAAQINFLFAALFCFSSIILLEAMFFFSIFTVGCILCIVLEPSTSRSTTSWWWWRVVQYYKTVMIVAGNGFLLDSTTGD
jgi:hypothetical protein